MKNYIQPGNVLTIPAPVAVTSGGVVIAGAMKGIAAGDADLGASVDVSTEGVFELAKVAADVFSVGDAVYWDASTELATSVSTDNTELGYVVAAAGDGAASVRVKIG